LCAAAKGMGIHTAIETNGYLGDRLSDAELEQIDLVLLGLKSWGAAHQDLTGKDIGPTLDFARRLAARGRPVWVRFVLVPELTDDTGLVASIAKFAAELGNVQRVEVLPFHQLGRFKWEKLGLDYTLADATAPPHELVEETCKVFRAEGLQAYRFGGTSSWLGTDGRTGEPRCVGPDRASGAHRHARDEWAAHDLNVRGCPCPADPTSLSSPLTVAPPNEVVTVGSAL